MIPASACRWGPGGKDTVCPTGGGVGQPLFCQHPTTPTPRHPHLWDQQFRSHANQARQRLRMCVCACMCEIARKRESERGKVRGTDECFCIPGEREIPTPSSSLLLLLPIFPPGFPAGGGREGFFLTRAADAGNRLHSERDTGTP